MKKPKIISIILSIMTISFFLNLFWEISHSLLYNWNIPPLENNVYFYVPKIILATLGDMMYILIIFFVISIFKKNIFWVSSPKKLDYIALIVLGILFASFIEIKAKVLNLWSYNQYMPQILGIGITPLIQLAITSILTIFILNKFISKNKRR